MNFPLLVRRLPLMAIVFGAQIMAAQMPLSEGAENHPSYYQYPLRTWTQRAPDHSRNLGKIRDRRADTDTSLTRKLQSIVIPRIEFRQTTMRDAVEFLRQEGRRLDPDPNPDNRGANIIVESPTPVSPESVPVVPGLPTETTPPPGTTLEKSSTQESRISLTMTNLPLLEALKYVAKQGGLAIKVEANAVYIIPPDSRRFMFTAKYPVVLTPLGNSIHVSAAPLEDDQPPGEANRTNGYEKSWLESQGVSFPPGASATYLPRTHRLVVRNTQENLDKIVSVISSALKPTDPQPENP